MKFRRSTSLLATPPAVATGDIAFNLIIFFLVCASVTPDSGRRQEIPNSETANQKTEKNENVEVALTRTGVAINGTPLPPAQVLPRLTEALRAKTRIEDRVVVVKSSKDTPYAHWIQVTGWIEEAGGVIAIQREEEQTVTLP